MSPGIHRGLEISAFDASRTNGIDCFGRLKSVRPWSAGMLQARGRIEPLKHEVSRIHADHRGVASLGTADIVMKVAFHTRVWSRGIKPCTGSSLVVLRLEGCGWTQVEECHESMVI